MAHKAEALTEVETIRYRPDHVGEGPGPPDARRAHGNGVEHGEPHGWDADWQDPQPHEDRPPGGEGASEPIVACHRQRGPAPAKVASRPRVR